MRKILQIPLQPPFTKGEFPLYQEGIKGCVPLFGKEGLGSRCREALQREVEIFYK